MMIDNWSDQFEVPFQGPPDIDVFITGKFDDIIQFEVYCYSMQSWRSGAGSWENDEFSVRVNKFRGDEAELKEIANRVLDTYSKFKEVHMANWSKK